MRNIVTGLLTSVLPAIVAICVMTGISSCRKDYINGDLDGIWEVSEVIVDGETTVPEERRFMRFAFHVCQLSGWQDAFPNGSAFTNGNLAYDGATLSLDFPFATSADDREILRSWGIMENPVTFTVRGIDSKRMTLESGDVTIRLIKF